MPSGGRDRNGIVSAVIVIAATVTGACGGGAPVTASPDDLMAKAILTTLQSRPSSPLAAGEAARFRTVTGGLAPEFENPGAGPSARVVLPARSTTAVELEDQATGLAVGISLGDARDAIGRAADGYLVYRQGHQSGATVLHRASPVGVEDYLAFDVRPATAAVGYDLDLVKGVGGLRLVSGTLEILDPSGAPRLRASPPYIVGADGARTDAAIAVEGCAVDTNPAGPWDRPLTPAGARRCHVVVSWADEAIRYPAILDPRWTTTGSLGVPRQDHALISLPLTGKVLAVGGRSGPTSTTGLSSAELYDKTTGTWAATNPMTGARWSASATLLGTSSNGTTSQKVLIAGGINGTASVNTAQLYSQTAGTWLAAGNLNAPRHLHSATLLADGRVLAAGGMNGTSTLQTAALYNPATGAGSWTATSGPIPPPGLRFHVASLITTSNAQLNNKVLLAGGNDGTKTVSSVFLFDPAQSAFSTLAAMPSAREGHTATVLPSGKLLLAGGKNGTTILATAVVFDPSSGPGSWTAAGTMTTPRWGHSATLLPAGFVANGQVLIAGGSNGTATLGSAELFSGSNSWTSTTPLPAPVQQHAAALLGGRVLIAGGLNGTTTQAAARLYDASFGLACTSASQCATGFCANGFCCDTACNGGCGACNVPGQEGTCSPLTRGTTCRAAAGVCDVPETCDGSSLACPADALAPSTTTCRPSAGPCDVAETCTGTSAACPTDRFASGATICRVASGVCDVTELCSGTSAACPVDQFVPAGTVCRAAAGACDVAEACTGTSANCPADALLPSTTVCRPAVSVCDVAETCTGTLAACPPDAFAPPSTICRSAAGACDVAELCPGTSATCPPDALAPPSTVCRAASGTCDVAETCTGASVACPPDDKVPDGTACNDGNACTLTDSCQGGSCVGSSPKSCPAADQCHAAGTCDPASGACSNPQLPDGTACDDGDVCTAGESCAAGSCAGGAPQTSCPIVAKADWKMAEHFVGMDNPPPAPVPSCPPTSQLCALPDSTFGCATINPIQPGPCVAQPCVTGSTSSCRLACGGLGIKNCSASSWGACQPFERCNGRDDDCDGNIDNGSVCQVPLSIIDPNHGPGWDAELKACDTTSTNGPITQYQWDVKNLRTGQVQHLPSSATCSAPVVFPSEDSYQVTLNVVDSAQQRTKLALQADVKNRVIVSMGDSIASGEGNPDIEAENNSGVPIWQNKRCHRSLVSWHAQAARAVELLDPHSSVTFLPVACSGAGTGEILTKTYKGIEEDGIEEQPQLSAVAGVLQNNPRAIDMLFMQIGANDVGFGDTVKACAVPPFYRPSNDLLDALEAIALLTDPALIPIYEAMKQLPDGDILTCANGTETTKIANLMTSLGTTVYPQLDTALRQQLQFVQPNGIYIGEYPDPLHTTGGALCSEIRLQGAVDDNVVPLIPPFSGGAFDGNPLEAFPLSVLLTVAVAEPDGVITGQEVAWAEDHVVLALNAQIAAAADPSKLNWTFVGGMDATDWFGSHGYCAPDAQRWIRHYEESKIVQKTIDGAVHPNVQGHLVYANFLLGSLH